MMFYRMKQSDGLLSEWEHRPSCIQILTYLEQNRCLLCLSNLDSQLVNWKLRLA